MGVPAMPYKEKKNSVFAAPPLNIENKSNFWPFARKFQAFPSDKIGLKIKP